MTTANISKNALEKYLNNLLEIDNFQDYCPNGLQVAGRESIKCIVTGVTASRALLEKALVLNADAILVHHGYFWRNEDSCITGMKKKRLQMLLSHDVNLFAYHLPLDAHKTYGNNVQLAKILGWQVQGTLANTQDIGFFGKLANAISADALVKQIEGKLNRKPLHIGDPDKKINSIAWSTGAAQSFIKDAIDHGVDAYITGEVSEATCHIARENNINFIAAGHHATERYGIKSLGEHLAEKFNLQHYFVDVDNPV